MLPFKRFGNGETIIYIYDIDAITTEDEIVEPIEKVTGKGGTTIKSLRRLSGGRQAATIAMEADKADIILKNTGLKIGCVTCRIKKKVFQMLDSRSRGRKCGSAEHKIAECKEETKYWI